MRANTFLSQHNRQLIETAKDASPGILGHASTGRLLRRVHADFEAVVNKPGRRPSLPGEDVFWRCVTILEELADTSPLGTTRDPYVSMMLAQLRSMGSRLANAERLPPEFQIHWFDNRHHAND